MKILSYNSTYVGSGHNAGSETTLHDVNLLLKTEGHEVTHLASKPFADGSGSYVIDGLMVNAYSSKQDPNRYFPGHDLILAQLETAARASLVGQQLEIPTLQLVHNYTEFSRGIAKKYCDGLVFNSEHVSNVIRNEDHVTKPAVVLHPLVDPKRYRVESSRRYVTLVNLSDGEAPWYDKGHSVFYWLAERFPDVEFLGVKGAYGNQDVREMDNVTIWEHQHNPLEIYRQSKIILQPSTVESFGRVAVEAAASGIPSIVSDLPGPNEAGVSYAYLDPRDLFYWEGALQELLKSKTYDEASDAARWKSNELWLKTKKQIPEFLRLVEEVSRGTSNG